MSTRASRREDGTSRIWLSTRVTRALGLGVHVYRLGDVLIDTGFRHARESLRSWPGLQGLQACVLTHHHEDHAGNVKLLARLGVPLLAPPPVREKMQESPALHLYQKVIWGTFEPAAVAPLDEIRLSDGRRLVPVPTPGHSGDHHVYHEPERGLVFSGDLYLGRRVDAAKREENVHDLLRSLRTVRELRPRTLYCAHRGRVDEPVQRLSEKIAGLEEIVGSARRLADRGRSVREIVRELFGREGRIYWITAGDFSHRNLIESALDMESDDAE